MSDKSFILRIKSKWVKSFHDYRHDSKAFEPNKLTTNQNDAQRISSVERNLHTNALYACGAKDFVWFEVVI